MFTELREKEQAMNDTQITIRNATPHDGQGLRSMFSRASSQTIYSRFHLPFPEVPEWMLSLMLDADQDDKGVLLALAGEEIVGHAMYVRPDDGTEAEMAIVVEDGWQSKGVGRSLLIELAHKARLGGIEIFSAEVLGENRRMLALCAAFAGTGYMLRDDVYHVRMPLRTLQPTAHAARTIGRAA